MIQRSLCVCIYIPHVHVQQYAVHVQTKKVVTNDSDGDYWTYCISPVVSNSLFYSFHISMCCIVWSGCVCTCVCVSVRAPVEQRVNSVAGWCGTGGNASLVFEEGGRGWRRVRKIDAGNMLTCWPLSLLLPSHSETCALSVSLSSYCS